MAYFFKALQLLKPHELVESKNSTSRFIITGHSLGGALASLFSLYMKDHLKWDNPLTTLITFGQPRVGDANYANTHDAFISPNQKLRLVYRYDIIPHLPSADITRYRHHSREVWIYKRHVKKISWKNWYGVGRHMFTSVVKEKQRTAVAIWTRQMCWLQ